MPEKSFAISLRMRFRRSRIMLRSSIVEFGCGAKIVSVPCLPLLWYAVRSSNMLASAVVLRRICGAIEISALSLGMADGMSVARVWACRYSK